MDFKLYIAAQGVAHGFDKFVCISCLFLFGDICLIAGFIMLFSPDTRQYNIQKYCVLLSFY